MGGGEGLGKSRCNYLSGSHAFPPFPSCPSPELFSFFSVCLSVHLQIDVEADDDDVESTGESILTSAASAEDVLVPLRTKVAHQAQSVWKERENEREREAICCALF
jgi:hypothetical protein